MSKIIKLVFFFIFILPFTIIVSEKYFFSYLTVMSLFLAFYFADLILSSKRLKPIDYGDFMNSSYLSLFLVFISYIIFKSNLVFDVFHHLLLGDLIDWSLKNAISRYNGEVETPGIFYNLGTTCMFIYAILLGSIKKNKKSLLPYIGMLFIFFIESSTLGRAGTVVSIVAFFSELLIRRNYFFQIIPFSKILKISLIPLVLLSVVFFYSAINRLDANDDIYEIMQLKLGEYFIGPYQAFLIWHTDLYYQTDNNTPPLYNLFTSFYRLIGFNVERGMYDLVNTDYGKTNIFTIIRALYSDLGYFISFFSFFITGLVFKFFTYKRMNYIQYFFIRIVLYIILLVIYSPFYISTFLLATIISYILLLFMTNNRKGSNLLKKQINISKNI